MDGLVLDEHDGAVAKLDAKDAAEDHAGNLVERHAGGSKGEMNRRAVLICDDVDLVVGLLALLGERGTWGKSEDGFESLTGHGGILVAAIQGVKRGVEMRHCVG